MSWKVFLNTRSRLFSRCSRSHSCLNFLKRPSIGNRPKFIEPMLRDATSGAKARRADPLLDGHAGRTAGGQVDHAVGALLDHRQERREGLRRLVRPARLRVARVQVHDGGARLGGADRRVGDLVGRHRQMRRHRRRMDGTGHGAGDDDLVHLRACLRSFHGVHEPGSVQMRGSVRRRCRASSVNQRRSRCCCQAHLRSACVRLRLCRELPRCLGIGRRSASCRRSMASR